MKRQLLFAILFVGVLITFSLTSVTSAQMEDNTKDCETCPMKVGAEAQTHFTVTDVNGTIHYVECFGCALKLLNKIDQLHIVTFCDWYGPNYTITVDISKHGAVTTLNPSTAVFLKGGGCTSNRVAYNQTAANALLKDGYSQYTMMMQRQALPANTNTTSITQAAKAFVPTDTTQTPQSPIVPILIGLVGVTIGGISFAAYKKLKLTNGK